MTRCAAFAALIGLGTAGMCTLEGWTLLQGAYWAVVTLSTVGYGQLVPASAAGQLFATGFMLEDGKQRAAAPECKGGLGWVYYNGHCYMFTRFQRFF